MYLQPALRKVIRFENQECQEVQLGKHSWSVCWEGQNLVWEDNEEMQQSMEKI